MSHSVSRFDQQEAGSDLGPEFNVRQARGQKAEQACIQVY